MLIEVKPFGKLKTHVYEYNNYQSHDYDIVEALGIKTNMIYLTRTGLLGKKVDRVTHIPDKDFTDIYEFVKTKIN